MPDKDDVFKRYLEAGLSFFEMTQQRAEAALKDLAGSGESAKGQAQKAVDWMKERGRQGTDELRELVRNEIRSQIEALGLVTTDDVARLEARLAALEAAGPASGDEGDATARAGAPKAKATAGSRKAAGITKAASAGKAPGKAAGPTAPAAKKAARPAKGAVPPGGGPKGAPGVGTPDEKG